MQPIYDFFATFLKWMGEFIKIREFSLFMIYRILTFKWQFTLKNAKLKNLGITPIFSFILQIFAGNQFYIAREYIFVDFVFNGLGWVVKGFDKFDLMQEDFYRLFKKSKFWKF